MEKIKNIRKRLRHQRSVRRRKLGLSTPTQIICVSFIAVIALGTLLLTLPIASRHGRLDVLNAMFTATSATCVTGLVVRDTWTQFTWFGQAVVLLLIQVGGLGLVTLTSFFALAMRRRMGFRDLRLLGESVSADGYDQAKSVLKIVVGLAAMFEGIGILLLLFAFVPQFGLEGVWISVFTAISAFCNAGFDLFGRFGAYSSLVPYVNNYYVQAVIIFMIISGGLGFMVWVELCQWYQKRRLSLHAKVVLSFSVILWLGGALGLGLMEWNNPATLGGLSVPGKVMASLFQSVSTRTAGMNTVDLASCGTLSKLLMSVLQFIGAAPGSTGGGVKVTTFAVIILTIRSVAQGRDDCVIADHHIESKTVYRALTIRAGRGGGHRLGHCGVLQHLGRRGRGGCYLRVLLGLWYGGPFRRRNQPAEQRGKDPVYAGHVHGPCRPGGLCHEPDRQTGRQHAQDHAGGAYQRRLNEKRRLHKALCSRRF